MPSKSDPDPNPQESSATSNRVSQALGNGDARSTPPAERLPVEQSTLLWGALGVVATIILTAVGVALRDSRWVLFTAWPFAILAIYEFLRYKVNSRHLKSLAVLGAIVALGGLYLLYVELPSPSKEPDKGSPQLNIKQEPILPAATPPQKRLRVAKKNPAPVVPTATPSPTPITADELAEKVAERIVAQQPTPTPTPLPPCRADSLTQCADEDLLDWGKPLVREISRYYGYYQEDIKKGNALEGMKSLEAHNHTRETLAARFLDCCAYETVSYYKEITSRLGGGHQQKEFFDWEDRLVRAKQGSKEWHDVAFYADSMILNIRYELELRMIELESAIRLRKVKGVPSH